MKRGSLGWGTHPNAATHRVLAERFTAGVLENLAVMEANALARQQVVDDKLHHDHVKTLLETQNLKIQQLEQRLEFTESLLEARPSRYLGGGKTRKELA